MNLFNPLVGSVIYKFYYKDKVYKLYYYERIKETYDYISIIPPNINKSGIITEVISPGKMRNRQIINVIKRSLGL